MLILMAFWMQSGFFMDGTYFRFKNGDEVKTLAEVNQDIHNYFWHEDGHFHVYDRKLIAEVSYFSVYVYGVPPLDVTKTTRERRISGKTIAYQRDDQTHFRFQMVDLFGKSLAGKVGQNVLRSLYSTDPSSYQLKTFRFELLQPNTSQNVRISFYDWRGKPVVEKTLDLSEYKIKKKKIHGQFSISEPIDAKQIGLVEFCPDSIGPKKR